jgi:hypothetical protein
LRLFVPPVTRETPQAVLDALRDGQIPNLNVLKLRLGMALQESSERGVRLGTVWDTLRESCSNFSELAASLNWSLEHLTAIDSYCGSDTRYHFVSVETVQRLFEAEGAFRLERVHQPNYALGERCPSVVFARTS